MERAFFYIFGTMTIAELHILYLQHPQVCTDTRKIEQGCIFFALKGDNFNGNLFAQQALENGAAYAVVDEAAHATSDQTILVPDVLGTLQQLALHHRRHCKARVISLTGSNGKTTTKELIHAVISQSYKTIATKGNLNNHIGVPLTLLSITPDTEMAIVEMGANHLKEIEFLCGLAEPDFGYITNFGKAHLEGFGGVEGVIKGKSELYTFLMDHHKHIFMNADDPIQREKLDSYIQKIGFSTSDTTYFKIEFLGAHPFVKLQVEQTEIQTQLLGSYNFPNCCAAITMGKYFNVPLASIKKALEGYVPSNNRSQIIHKNGKEVILDAYNANPSSMAAALENLENLDRPHKIAILGDMFELGQTAAEEHQHIADLATQKQLDAVFLVGENFFGTKGSPQRFPTFADLKKYLEDHSLPEATILVKGSRGMAMERLLDLI